jgi:hypothetical protein
MQKEESIYAALFDQPGTSITNERILWLHVLAQALIDCSVNNPEVKQEAVSWVGTPDFEEVCNFAGVDPPFMHSLFQSVMSERSSRRAFKKAMQFRFLVRTYIENNMGFADKL